MAEPRYRYKGLPAIEATAPARVVREWTDEQGRRHTQFIAVCASTLVDNNAMVERIATLLAADDNRLPIAPADVRVGDWVRFNGMLGEVREVNPDGGLVVDADVLRLVHRNYVKEVRRGAGL